MYVYAASSGVQGSLVVTMCAAGHGQLLVHVLLKLQPDLLEQERTYLTNVNRELATTPQTSCTESCQRLDSTQPLGDIMISKRPAAAS